MNGWSLAAALFAAFVIGFLVGLEVLGRAVRGELEKTDAQAKRIQDKMSVIEEHF